MGQWCHDSDYMRLRDGKTVFRGAPSVDERRRRDEDFTGGGMMGPLISKGDGRSHYHADHVHGHSWTWSAWQAGCPLSLTRLIKRSVLEDRQETGRSKIGTGRGYSIVHACGRKIYN